MGGEWDGGRGGGDSCYVDLTGGGVALKPHFLSPDSLAKGVSFGKNVFGKFIQPKE